MFPSRADKGGGRSSESLLACMSGILHAVGAINAKLVVGSASRGSLCLDDR